MSRLLLKFSSVLLFGLLILIIAPIPALAATELITNGGFETGNFSGWTAAHVYYNEGQTGLWCASWEVITVTRPECVFEPITPPKGSYMAFNSMDGDPMYFTMYQDVTIPAGSTALFSMMYRAQWYNYNRGWTQERTMDVQIRNTSNAILKTIHHFSTGDAVCCFIHEDTHWVNVTADLSEFAGQTIRLFIYENVPQSFTGGSEIYFDDFSIQAYTGSVGKINVVQSGGTTTSTEGGTADSFTVTLSQAPTSNVSVDLTAGSGCSVNQDPVVLTSGNWNTGVTVTVTATNDSNIEGNHPCLVTTAPATSSDAAFNTVDPIDVSAVLFDNDGAAPSMTSCAPPVPTQNEAFSYTMTATGNPAPIFTRSSEALPDGISMNSSGVFSGTPPTDRNYGFLITVAAENAVGSYDYAAFRPIVRPDTPHLPWILFPTPGGDHFSDYQPMPGMVNKFYCLRFQSNGFPAPTYSLMSGTLPAGLSLVGDTITGTPTAAGTSNTITITATNIYGSENRSFTITIYPAAAPPAVTSSAPPAANVGTPYSHTFTATGGPSPQFGLNGAALPPGLTFDNNTISGTPTAAGSYGVISAVARNGIGRSAAQDFTLTVNSGGSAPNITSGAPPTGKVGTAYTHTFVATGSPAPTFSLSGASLPAGLNFSGGVISGTPTGTGGVSGTITVTASNGNLPDDTQNFTITINAAPDITSAAPPGGTVGASYSHTFVATGYPAPTFSLSGASLPAGLSFSGGVISGTPTASGTSGTITVTASNGVTPTDTQNFTITITAAPNITSAAPAAAKVGTPYTHTFVATGSPAPTFSLSGASLPAGLSFSGGVISGTPTGTGGESGTITVTASNGVNPNDTQDFTITVNAAPDITSAAPAAAKVGTDYTHTFVATGYPAPTFSITAGTLPAGLSFDSGVISGTPTGTGGVSGTITVRASNGITPNDTQDFTITVNAAPDITSAAPAVAKVGTAYTHTFVATGYPAPTFSITAGTLPAGLSFDSGVISGTPTGTGGVSGQITVTASNGVNPNDTQNFTITVNAAPDITSAAPAAAKVGTAYTHTFVATGYPAPTFSITAGTLPAGLSLSGGVISGMPTGTGGVSGTITVRASNGITPNDTQNFTITVNAAPIITSAEPPDGTIGAAYSHTFIATGYPAPTFSISGGSLPAGLSWDGVNKIVGTPILGVTTTTITVTATNGITPNDTQNFTITVESAEDAAPALTYFTTATPTLRWSRVNGATTYEIQVARDLGFTDMVYEKINIPAGTLADTVSPALPDGTYYWRVRAAGGSWSAKQRITVNG